MYSLKSCKRPGTNLAWWQWDSGTFCMFLATCIILSASSIRWGRKLVGRRLFMIFGLDSFREYSIMCFIYSVNIPCSCEDQLGFLKTLCIVLVSIVKWIKLWTMLCKKVNSTQLQSVYLQAICSIKVVTSFGSALE